MPLILLRCTTDCTICCRYPEFLPSEIGYYASIFPLGLRVSLVPIPESVRQFFFRRELARTLPVLQNMFCDIRIVGAGYYSLFHHICPWYTKKKKEQKEAHCKGNRPLPCQARPLEPMFAEKRQLDVIAHAETSVGCHGISQKIGTPILESKIFTSTVLGKLGEAYKECYSNRLEYLPTYQRCADIIQDILGSDIETLISGISRNTFMLFPFQHFLRAMYETDRAELSFVRDIVSLQIEMLVQDRDAFLTEYGEKRLFASVTRPDGENITPHRGQYLQRIRDWIAQYTIVRKRLETT